MKGKIRNKLYSDRDPVPKAKPSKEASSGEDLKFFNKEDVPTLKKPVYYIEYGLGFILFLYVLNYVSFCSGKRLKLEWKKKRFEEFLMYWRPFDDTTSFGYYF